jgi:hypothetical protein
MNNKNIIRNSGTFYTLKNPKSTICVKFSQMWIWIAQWYSAGLRARWSRIRVPARVGNFSLHHRVQTGSGAHTASYPVGTTGSFAGVKRPGRKPDYSLPSSTEVKEWVELYIHSSNTPSCRGAYLSTETTLLFLLLSVSTVLEEPWSPHISLFNVSFRNKKLFNGWNC